MVQLPTRHNVKAASHPGKMLQDGQIPVGLYGKTQGVRQRAKALVQFLVGTFNCRTTIHIRWRTELLRNRIQRNSFAHHYLAAAPAPLPLFPSTTSSSRPSLP